MNAHLVFIVLSLSKTLAVYPSNTQFQAHFCEFTKNGYCSGFESCQVKFFVRDGSRVPPHRVGLVDGRTKILIMAGIVCGVTELDLDINHSSLQRILGSLIQCGEMFLRPFRESVASFPSQPEKLFKKLGQLLCVGCWC